MRSHPASGSCFSPRAPPHHAGNILSCLSTPAPCWKRSRDGRGETEDRDLVPDSSSSLDVSSQRVCWSVSNHRMLTGGLHAHTPAAPRQITIGVNKSKKPPLLPLGSIMFHPVDPEISLLKWLFPYLFLIKIDTSWNSSACPLHPFWADSRSRICPHVRYFRLPQHLAEVQLLPFVQLLQLQSLTLELRPQLSRYQPPGRLCSGRLNMAQWDSIIVMECHGWATWPDHLQKMLTGLSCMCDVCILERSRSLCLCEFAPIMLT